MTTRATRSHLFASLTAYLEELQESGVDGIPVDLFPVAVGTPQSGVLDNAPGETPESHETLEHIRKSLGACQRCPLGATRKNLVFGAGNPKARLVFVGEGPGADEDEQGAPFVGAAGKILDRIIAAMELKREDVYICNVVKCRPPGNRPPEENEMASCSPFLLRQLASIKPDVIVALGATAAKALLNTQTPISKLRGKFHDLQGTPVMPTYHPSYLLRAGGNSDAFWNVWDDMTQVLQLLKLPVPVKNRKSR